MIYLICAKDSKERVVELNDKETYKDNYFYKYFVNNFEHKNVLYPIEFFNHIVKKPLPNRVNIIYTHKDSSKKDFSVKNAIITDNIKDIIKSYKNEVDDIYILAANRWIIEEFESVSDYIIIFVSDESGYTFQPITDYIDFSNYNLLRSQTFNKYRYEFYVTNKKAK